MSVARAAYSRPLLVYEIVEARPQAGKTVAWRTALVLVGRLPRDVPVQVAPPLLVASAIHKRDDSLEEAACNDRAASPFRRIQQK